LYIRLACVAHKKNQRATARYRKGREGTCLFNGLSALRPATSPSAVAADTNLHGYAALQRTRVDA
jgi:hypothetical protein